MNVEDYMICPHCGKENLIQASRCIHCKEHLDVIPASAAEMAANEEDITEMLSTMNEEGEESELPAPVDNPSSLMPETSEPQLTKNEENEPEEIPEWLAHIRQRAQSEGDAQGLYNRESTVTAGQKGPSREGLDQPFNSWVGRVHADQSSGESPEGKTEEMPVWLKRVRDLQLQPDENMVNQSIGVDAWKQEWSEEDLERLKNGEFDEKPNLQPSLLEQSKVKETREIPVEEGIETSVADEKLKDVEPDEIATEVSAIVGEISDETADEKDDTGVTDAAENLVKPEEDHEEILKGIVAAEALPQVKKIAEKPKKTDVWRWIGIIFLLAMLVAFYLLFLNRPAPAPLGSAAGAAFWNRVNSVQPSSKVLIILDYQAATADEMQANLEPVMSHLKAKDALLRLVALWPDGLWLGRELLEETALPPETALNFLPGGTLAMLRSAAELQVAGASLEDQNSIIGNNLALKETDLILYATDNPDSARIWIEQVGSFLLPEQSLVVSTQASQVMLQPYYDSSQIAGMSYSPYHADGSLVAGNPAPAATPAFEAGMGVMAGFLALSFLGKLLKTNKNKPDEEGKA